MKRPEHLHWESTESSDTMTDRHVTAVEFRSLLRRELDDALAAIRPDQLTLIEINDLLAILRPAVARVRSGRSVTPPADT